MVEETNYHFDATNFDGESAKAALLAGIDKWDEDTKDHVSKNKFKLTTHSF